MGHIFKMTSFGESHGPGYGVVIEGCPAGLIFDYSLLKKNLLRRRPGQSAVTSARQESDEPEILSGVFENKTLGTPICILVRNRDQRSADYDKIMNEARIGHADDTWKNKFGHVDHRGGGRSSGRETLVRVLAGSVAQMLCHKLCPDLKVKAYTKKISDIELNGDEIKNIWAVDVDSFSTRLGSKDKNSQAEQLLKIAQEQGESYGGIAEVQVKNIPASLGQPIFRKFKSDLAQAMLSLGACNSFEFGAGFDGNSKAGTAFHSHLQADVYGGIRGGITTGEDLLFRVGFKPTSSIKDVAKKGRHDPCILPRAVPVVEAMTWFLLAEHLLWQRLDRV